MTLRSHYAILVALACLLPRSVSALDSLCTKPNSIVEKTVCSNQTLRREEELLMRVGDGLAKQLNKVERTRFEKEFAAWRTEQQKQFAASIGDALPEGLQNKSIHDELIFGLRDYYLRKRVALFEQKELTKAVTKLSIQLFLQIQGQQAQKKADAVQLFAEIIEGSTRKTELADELYLGRSTELLEIFPTSSGTVLVAYKTNGGGSRSDYEFYLFTPRKAGSLFTLLPFDFFDEEKQKIDGSIESLGAVDFQFDSKTSRIKIKDSDPSNLQCETHLSYHLTETRFELDKFVRSGTCATGPATSQTVLFDRSGKKLNPAKNLQAAPTPSNG